VRHPADRVCLASRLAGRRATLLAGHGLSASPTALQAAGQQFIEIGTVPLNKRDCPYFIAESNKSRINPAFITILFFVFSW
jgi:hypothetical protein